MAVKPSISCSGCTGCAQTAPAGSQQSQQQRRNSSCRRQMFMVVAFGVGLPAENLSADL
jgi:hypothetical protein